MGDFMNIDLGDGLPAVVDECAFAVFIGAEDSNGQTLKHHSIILNLYLSRHDGMRVRLEALPIWTVNVPALAGRRFRNIQTVYLPDRITDLIWELAVSSAGKRRLIRRRIRYLSDRIDVMRKVLFYKQRIDEIKIHY